ncbi:MAG: mechanosensitive ion channel [Candidatus Dependentiae bacterium]|nr:mechanosensitive ion channel [Candidatus Dependentiae bacterium]
MLKLDQLRNFLSKTAVEDVIIFIVVLIILTLITRVIRGFSALLTRKFPTKRMAILLWVPFLNFMIYCLGFFITIVIVFEPTQEVYLGFLISMGVAIGLGAKELFQSLIAGLVLLIDKPFQVGDRIAFQDTYGDIMSIGLVSVKLLTLNEDVVTIPNYRFLNDVVSSSSAGELGMMATVDIYVRPESDLFKVKEILENIARESVYVNTEQKIFVVAKEVLGIAGIVSIAMKTKCIIKDSKTERIFQTKFLIDVNHELKKANIK